jgi:hypothetical protein
MTSRWEPYREPLRVTLARTGIIALLAGAVLSWRWGGVGRWPLATLLVLWLSLGGHYVEIWFLNYLRPRLAAGRAVQLGVRIGVWLVGGIVLVFGMGLTAMLAGFRPESWHAWWLGGVIFVFIELVAHLVLLLRGRPSVYNGRG